MVEAKGTVYAEGNASVEGALVVARSNGHVVYGATRDDGGFILADMPAGTYTLTAYDGQRVPAQLRDIDLSADKGGLRMDMRRPITPLDTILGYITLGVLIVGLVTLAIIYTNLHLSYPPTDLPLGAAVVSLVDQTTQKITSASDKPSASRDVLGQLAELKSGLSAAQSSATGMSRPPDAQVLSDLDTKIEQDIQADSSADALAKLAIMRAILMTPTSTTFLWTEVPWKFLEVVLWGLAGVLVSLILSVSYYVWRGTFYMEGIALHLAQLVTLPLLALVVIALLATVSISLTVSGNQIQLNMQDPQTIAVVAFLVALQPWNTVSMLRAASRSITGDTQRTTK